MSTFGQRLKKLRELEHLTQTQLAKLLGMSRENISLYEHDKNKTVPDPVIQKLSEVFTVPASYLRGEEEIEDDKLQRMLPLISVDIKKLPDGESHAFGSIGGKTIDLSNKATDLADEDIVLSFEGRRIPPEDLAFIRRFLRGAKDDK